MIDIIPIFPTLIGRSNFSVQNKEEIAEQLITQFNDKGYTGESEGFVRLHELPILQPIYEAVGLAIRQKLNWMNIDDDKFIINITKSWMNIVNDKHTPVHAHYDSHWSFTYYLNVPEGISKPLQFEQTKHPNDPYRGLVAIDVEEFNEFNAMTMAFEPQEGDIFIFPGDMLHSTIGYGTDEKRESVKSKQQLLNNRICIAGDVVFTHKKPAPKYLGLQPKNTWLEL